MLNKKNKYYSLDRIEKYNAIYNVIIGERSNGKTYSVLSKAIDNFIKDGKMFAYVRRWQTDVTGRRASSVFNAHNSDRYIEKKSGGRYEGITYYSGRFYACTYGDDGRPVYSDSDCMGYCFSLSDMEHDKSTSYPDVTLIMFDEFLTKNMYLNDEFVLFCNVVSTIVRQRDDVKIYMLGNTVNKYCPYFKEMGLENVMKMEQGTIDLYEYGDSGLTVAVEYCSSIKKSKKSNKYFAFNNPKLHMITGGAWEIDIYPHCPIKYKPRDIIFTYFIIFNDQCFQCEIVNDREKDSMFTFIHPKTTPLKDTDHDLIYSLEYDHRLNHARFINRPQNDLQSKIFWFFKTDRVYYSDNNTGDAIINYLKLCTGGI